MGGVKTVAGAAEIRVAMQGPSRPVLRAVAMAAVVLLLDVRASAQGERDAVV